MFHIFINDEEVICESKIQIDEEFMNPSSIELYKVYPKSWKGTNKLLTDYYFPQDYSKCKILKDNKLYFSGIVKNSSDMELNPFKPHFCSLQILDRGTLLSEGNTLDYVIKDKTVEEAIIQVIDSISDYGFVVGNINISEDDNTLIGAYSTLDKAPYDVFNYLSMISGTRWGTRMIDENTTAIDFYSPELLETEGIIDYTQEYFNKNKIEKLNYDYSTIDYRNKQIMLSDKVYSNISQEETKISDGVNNTCQLEYKIGTLLNVMVNGNYVTLATKDQRDRGITADIYYTPSDNNIEFNEIYPYGIPIKVKYIPLVKGRQIIYNNSEINRISNNLNINGTISRYENRSDVLSSKELEKVGQSYIKFKGLPKITLNITARKDFLKLGNKYHFNSPISELRKDYLVKSKTTHIFQNSELIQIAYDYELVNSFDTENELNYFDNQRAKTNGNIDEGETITRNIDIENTASIIFNNLSIEEITITGNNTLNNVLDSPLIE